MSAGTKCLLAFAALITTACGTSTKVLRVRYGNAAPMSYYGPQGVPRGFVVDVLAEVARREGISIEWVFSDRSPDTELQEGAIDVLPAGVITEERRSLFWLSKPWWGSDMVALSRHDGAVRHEQDLVGRRLAVPTSGIGFAKEYYSQVIVPVGRARDAVAQVCNGLVDGAIIAGVYLDELLVSWPAPCREAHLRTIHLPHEIQYALIGRQNQAREIERLRSRIEEITRDGALLRFALANPPVSTSHAVRLSEAARDHDRTTNWLWAMSGITVLLLVVTFFLFLLQASKQRFHTLVEKAPDAIFIQTNQRFAYINAAALRLFGASRSEQLLGNLVESRVDPGHRAQIIEHVQSLHGEETPAAALDSVFVKLDDSRIHVNVSAVPFEFGKHPSALVFVRDISERKRAAEDRERLQAQLAQAQKLESIGLLAGGIAHDFNNLLTVINGYSKLAIKALGPNEQPRALVEEVLGAGECAASLTKQLLAFSRRQILQPRQLRLNGVIEDVAMVLRRLLGGKVELHLALSADDPVVHADSSQLSQVIMNLSVNARDAMPNGGRLSIETGIVERDERYPHQTPDAKPGRYAMLAISDTGIGMDEATVKRVFEPFFTTKPIGQGTGLGLSTVHGIVVQSGGYVDVYSEAGQGTTFKVYLPSRTMSKEDSTLATASERNLRGNETILVVDDDAAVRSFAASVLMSYGYRVMQEPGSLSALARVVSEHIDLILTDVAMPDLSGPELARRVRDSRSDMRVLFMSGYTENVILRNRAFEGDVELIQKPFTPEALASKVRVVLDQPGKG